MAALAQPNESAATSKRLRALPTMRFMFPPRDEVSRIA
jgi:hypothetical protein